MYRGIRIVCGLLIALCGAAPASAQLFEFTKTLDTWPNSPRAGAYDPVHDVYFVAEQDHATFGLSGRFINRSGATVSTVALDSRPVAVARVIYSPDVSDGVGGRGGLVVVWTPVGSGGSVPLSNVGLFGQVVSLAVGAVGPATLLTDAWIPKFGLAYSPIDKVFLVGTNRPAPDAGYRDAARMLRLDTDLRPIDDISLSDPSQLVACQTTDIAPFCNEIDVAWNPVSGEFGVLYVSEQGVRVLARVAGSGTILSRTPLGIGAGEFFGALAVNITTGNYVAVVQRGDQTIVGFGIATDGAEITPSGTVVARGVVTSTLAHRAAPDLLYSEASGTFLLVGRDKPPSTFPPSPPGALRLLELNQHGVATGSSLSFGLGSYVAVRHASEAEWLVLQSDGGSVAHIIRSGTRSGGTSAHLPFVCLTPDPFVRVGGGTCVNGVWLPRPPPFCATPDPFVALGGGTCFNGGWLPPTMPPPATTCQTPDPFTALGGGVCVYGGWVPPTSPVLGPPPPPAPSPSVPGGCLSPDPFVAMGGGRCVNGGWIPPTMVVPPSPPPATCTTPDPFVAIGGGVCVEGGWRPRG